MNHYKKLLKQNKLPKETEPIEFFKGTAINLDEEFSSNRTLLQNAIMDQEEDLFNAIMEISKDWETKPPDVNTLDRTRKRWTALHHAVFNASLNGEQMVLALLKAGANPNIEDSDGKVPLNIAVEIGAMTIVDLLLKNGAKVNSGGNLHIALIFDKLDIFSFLLKQEDVDLEFIDDEGDTALHMAARLGYADSIKELLEKAKSKNLVKRLINLQSNNGNTPLHEAVLNEQKEVEKILYSVPEVDVEVKNKKGQTPQEIKNEKMKAKEKVEEEAQINEIRKRKKQIDKEKKQAGKIVLGEKGQRIAKEEYEEMEAPSFFSKAWVKCIIFSVILAAILYGFFYFHISKKQNYIKRN